VLVLGIIVKSGVSEVAEYAAQDDMCIQTTTNICIACTESIQNVPLPKPMSIGGGKISSTVPDIVSGTVSSSVNDVINSNVTNSTCSAKYNTISKAQLDINVSKSTPPNSVCADAKISG
jgi:hypothetical protein